MPLEWVVLAGWSIIAAYDPLPLTLQVCRNSYSIDFFVWFGNHHKIHIWQISLVSTKRLPNQPLDEVAIYASTDLFLTYHESQACSPLAITSRQDGHVGSTKRTRDIENAAIVLLGQKPDATWKARLYLRIRQRAWPGLWHDDYGSRAALRQCSCAHENRVSSYGEYYWVGMFFS